MKFKLISATAVALSLAACSAEETDVVTEEVPLATEAAPTEMTADTSTPQGFVTNAAASSLYEIEAARLALETSQDPQVTEFAQMMIDDHTTATRNLEQAAGQVPGVTVNPQLTMPQQRQLSELRAASAEEFDALYKQQQVAAHEQALNLMQQHDAGAAHPEPLRTFASTTAPIIERHLQMARELP